MRSTTRMTSFVNLILGAALLFCGPTYLMATAGAADFADAPDDPNVPGYPTLLAHDGARHLVGGPWLGQEADKPDEEADGQPDPNALGDDADGNDDENGVTIPPLHPGQVAVVTLDVRGGGVLQAWVDFDANDVWQPEEQVFNGFLTDGRQAIAFYVPADAAPGVTFARFRISSAGDLGPGGPAEDGEVEDHAVTIEPLSALAGSCQVPDVTQSGIGIRVDSNDGNVRWLADDFSSVSDDSVSHVRLWGSWKGDKAGTLRSIHLAIFPNDPVGPAGADLENEYAKPDLTEPLWQGDFDPNQFTEKLYHVVRWAGQWWWDPAGDNLVPAAGKQIWQVDIPVSSSPLSGSPEAPVIHWLAVEAHTERGEFGWNTRQWPHHDLADAVWDVGTEAAGVWKELRYPQRHPYQKQDPNSIDMAFCLEFPPVTQTPQPTQTGPTACGPCPPVTQTGPTACGPCPPPVTQTGPTLCGPCPTQTGPTLCGPCVTQTGPTLCSPCVTQSGPTLCSPCVTQSGPTACGPCVTMSATCVCPPPVTIGCPIFGQGKSRSQSAAARVVYTQQKDWLITDFTCPPIEVDCPAAVPEAVSLSGEARQPEQPRVSKDTRGRDGRRSG